MMRYISLLLLLSFLPQQNQLSEAEEEKGGLREAPVLVRTWSKSPGLVELGWWGGGITGRRGIQQTGCRRSEEGGEEMGGGTFKEKEGREEVGYPVDMHKQEESGEGGHSSGGEQRRRQTAAAGRPTQACQDAAS